MCPALLDLRGREFYSAPIAKCNQEAIAEEIGIHDCFWHGQNVIGSEVEGVLQIRSLSEGMSGRLLKLSPVLLEGLWEVLGLGIVLP